MKFLPQNFKLSTVHFLLLLSSAILSSCHKTNIPLTNPPVSLWKTISTDGDITFFRKLVELNKSSQAFDGTTEFTLLAPKDTAFVLAGFANTNALARLTPTQMVQLLNHLTLKGNYPYSSFTNNSFPTALNNSSILDSLYFSKFSATNSIYVDGKRISGYSVTASNGTLFIVNSFLPVPSPSIGTLIDSIAKSPQSDFTLLSEALKLTGFNTILRSKGPYTLLAPDDSAFAIAGYPNILSLDTMNLAHLTRLISVHIIPKRVYSQNLIGSGWNTFNNMGRDSIFISNNSLLVNGPDTSQATLIYTNLETENGVVHVLDHLLKNSINISLGHSNKNSGDRPRFELSNVHRKKLNL